MEAQSSTGVNHGLAVPPRLSFGSWAFAFGPFERAPWDFGRICRYVAEAGYDGIEINGFRPHPHDADFSSRTDFDAVRRVLDCSGLAVSGYAPDFRDTPPADVALATYLARVDSTLAFCRGLQIPTLRTDTVSPPGPMGAAPADAERRKRLVRAWREAASRCADSGVLLVWEFEPGFWLNRPHDVLALADDIAHPNFKILFDTSHAYTGAVTGARQGQYPDLLTGGVAEYASLLREHIGHLHLIDSDGTLHDDETSAHLAFGAGNICFPDVLAELPSQGLDLAWWTVDFCFSDTTEADGRTAVPFVRRLLAEARSGAIELAAR